MIGRQSLKREVASQFKVPFIYFVLTSNAQKTLKNKGCCNFIFPLYNIILTFKIVFLSLYFTYFWDKEVYPLWVTFEIRIERKLLYILVYKSNVDLMIIVQSPFFDVGIQITVSTSQLFRVTRSLFDEINIWSQDFFPVLSIMFTFQTFNIITGYFRLCNG